MRGTSIKHVDEYMATVCDQLRATLQEAQASQQQKPNNRNGTMTKR